MPPRIPTALRRLAAPINYRRPALPVSCWSPARWSTSGTPTVGSLAVLRHDHFTTGVPGGFVPYDDVSAAQEALRSKFLAWKANPVDPPPRPHLLTFEATPTVTMGRRQAALTPDQMARLEAPLQIRLSPLLGRPNSPWTAGDTPPALATDVRQTGRGGLTTYHGPGQLVFWPVVDMHSPLHARYSVLSYAAHLEATTRRLLASAFGIETYTARDEPGVWVKLSDDVAGPERKIAALGVHHRRHVTALGIALNVDVAIDGPEERNPWARFVPCGLEGKAVTSVAAELRRRGDGEQALASWTMPALAARWAELFDEGLQDERAREVDGEAEAGLRRAKV